MVNTYEQSGVDMWVLQDLHWSYLTSSHEGRPAIGHA